MHDRRPNGSLGLYVAEMLLYILSLPALTFLPKKPRQDLDECLVHNSDVTGGKGGGGGNDLIIV